VNSTNISKFPPISKLLQTVLLTDNSTFSWMMEIGLLPNYLFCRICNSAMELKLSENPYWICRKCLSTNSGRCNSIFFNSNLSLKQMFLLIHHFWNRDTVFRSAENTECSAVSVVNWNHRLRFVMINKLLKCDVKLGGRGSVVEIDEACIRRRKYKKGKCKKELWVLGAIEREKNFNEKRKMFLEVVPDRTSETLCEIILRRIIPETHIISDGWAAYSGLSSLGYQHSVVNHSKNFKDPIKNAYTNNIEGNWLYVRHHLGLHGSCGSNVSEN
jgi:hypothetical protein